MKLKRILLLTLLLINSLSFSAYGALPYKDPSVITPEKARKLAEEAYIFAYPLVANYRSMYLEAVAHNSKTYIGGFGKWHHYEPATPATKQFKTANVDTPYSKAWVDLRAEPWVLTLPPIPKDRYYSSQWDDLWGFIIASPGSIKNDNRGGNYLLVDAYWQGTRPRGIKQIIRGETQFLGGLSRTEYFGQGDLRDLKDLQKGYKLQPLSHFLRTKPAPAAPELAWPDWNEGDESSEKFFTYVNFMLPFTKPNLIDRSILKRIAEIGVISGQPWHPEEMSPGLRTAIQQGILDGAALLATTAKSATQHAQFFGNRRKHMDAYLNRAVGVYVAMFSNLADHHTKLTWSADAEGNYLDGSRYNYQIKFPPGSFPPVKFFWSITLYSLPKHALVPNPLDRYALGSRSQDLQLEADGSLIIYLQENSPGLDKENNWLPTPNGPFYAMLRTYGPEDAVIRGEWALPPIQRYHRYS